LLLKNILRLANAKGNLKPAIVLILEKIKPYRISSDYLGCVLQLEFPEIVRKYYNFPRKTFWHANRSLQRVKWGNYIMNTEKLTRKIRIYGLAFALLFGIGVLSATTANAQWRDDDDRYDDRYDNNGNYDNALRQAYREGYRQGLQDARNGRRANANRAAGQAMRGINNGRWNNNQRNFRQAYREAFIRGYNQGYDRNDDYYDNSDYDDRYNDRNDRRNNRNKNKNKNRNRRN
jgi:hypothetical protein